MRIAFFGTPEAAVPTLKALPDVGDVVGVITRPDAARGRSGRPVPSPIAVLAEREGMPLHRPADRSELAAAVRNLAPFDVGVVVAYGMILRPEVLAVPGRGFVNVHVSVLPRWRGAAPVARALLAGDTRTGVTLMQMDEGLDTGPIIATWSTRIGPSEDAVDLTGRLATGGAKLAAATLRAHVEGRTAPTAQDESAAIYADKLRSEERWLRPGDHAGAALQRVRGLAGWPGAWIHHDTGPLRIHLAEPTAGEPGPGSVVVTGDRVLLGFEGGAIEARVVQPAGKRPMEARAWARGLQGEAGAFR